MDSNRLLEYKGHLYDPSKVSSRDEYTIIERGQIDDLNCIPNTLDVTEIKMKFRDGLVLRLTHDGDAETGKKIDTYV
jgi:hypothetical protein